MFDIGIAEIILVALLALIVIGPEELPHALRSLAQIVRKWRSSLNMFETQVKNYVDLEGDQDIKSAIQHIKHTTKNQQLKD